MAENKERLTGEKVKVQKEPMVDVEARKKAEVKGELKSWMEKIEESPTAQPVQINDSVVLQPTAGTKSIKIVLPITRNTFVTGFKKSVSEAGRWLSAFIFRLIKIKKGEVKFKNES